MVINDADLVARALLQQDRHAFASLVRQHHSMVRGFLRRLCKGDNARADDLSQETFLKAWQHLGSWRGGGRFSSWLCGIAWRQFLSDQRKRGQHTSDGVVPEPSIPSPEEPLHRARDVQQALRTLSDAEQAVMALCFTHDLTHEEAAAALQMPVGTVKTHVHRGKEKLRGCLSTWDDAGGAP